MPDENNVSTEEANEVLLICAFDCTEQNVKRCRKCNRPFCIIHCNAISPNFCKECFRDIRIISEKFKRTFDHVANNGQMYIKTDEQIKYYLDGPDWPFVMPWIDSLSDDELKSLWVFHHSIMKLIEVENDTRNIERNRQLRESPMPRLITGTTKTGAKTIKKVQIAETPAQLEAKWRKMGLPEATIKMMVAALGIPEVKP